MRSASTSTPKRLLLLSKLRSCKDKRVRNGFLRRPFGASCSNWSVMHACFLETGSQTSSLFGSSTKRIIQQSQTQHYQALSRCLSVCKWPSAYPPEPTSSRVIWSTLRLILPSLVSNLQEAVTNFCLVVLAINIRSLLRNLPGSRACLF